MTPNERYKRHDKFIEELRLLLHKTVGTTHFTDADPELMGNYILDYLGGKP